MAAGFILYGQANGFGLLLAATLVMSTGFHDFDMAQTTYLDKIATRDEIPATMSTGSTINHISGVGFPLLGGIIWRVMGPGATFVFGAILAAASAVASTYVRTEPVPVKATA